MCREILDNLLSGTKAGFKATRNLVFNQKAERSTMNHQYSREIVENVLSGMKAGFKAILNLVFNQKKERKKMDNQKSKSTFSATLLSLILMVTALGVSSAVGAEKKMVKDPTTGKMVTAPAYGGTLTYASRVPTLYVDPRFGGCLLCWFSPVAEKLGIGDWGIDREEFDLISGYMPLSVIKGSLAESWEMPDDKTYVFHIRKGVRWQDKAPMNGRELTANDIEYNWHRMLGLGSGYDEPMPNLWGELASVPWESITATDKFTLVVRLKEPNLGALRNILIHHSGVIYPPEVIEASKTDEWPEGRIEDPMSVVGTGPYMVADYVEGSSMTFTKNPDYWGYDEKYPENRLPYIDTLTNLMMLENATILAALRSGRIDYAGFNGFSNLKVDLAESLQKTNPEIALTQWAQRSEVAFSFIVTEPPFNDVNVRHAMQMALDLETINDTYYKGFADTTPSQLIGVKGYIFPFAEWPDEVKKSYMYDPVGAEALLDAAGYPRGADGIRFKTKLTSLDLFDVDYAELAATYWDEIGVDVEISVLDRPAYMSAMHGLTYRSLLHTIAGYDNDPMSSITWAHSGQIGKSNVTGLQDPVYDAMVEAAQAATSIEEQQRVVRVIDLYHVVNHLRVWGPKVPQFKATQPWVVGFNGEIDLGWGDRPIVFSRLWIDQDLKREMGK